MKYLKKTFEYANSKFFYLVFLSIIPAFFLSLFFSPAKIITFLCNYQRFELADFSSTYALITVLRGKQYYWLLLGLVLCSLSVSLIYGAVDRHMRVGEFTVSFKYFVKRINYNFISAMMLVISALMIFELTLVLDTVFFLLFATTLSPLAAQIVSIVFALFFALLLLFMFSLIIDWLPSMLHTGLSIGKAFALAVRQSIRYMYKILIALFLPTLPMLILMIINGIFNLRLEFLLDTVLYALIVVYYVILSCTLFFDLNGIERVDISEDFWKKYR